MEEFVKARSMVLEELNTSLSLINTEQVEEMIEMIYSAEKIFVIGVGRVLLMMQAIAKRLNHLGFDVNFINDTCGYCFWPVFDSNF